MEKVSLPIKTKIAAWWMMIIGVSTVILSFGVIFRSFLLVMIANPIEFILPSILFIALGLFLYIIPSYLLFKRKKSGWFASLISPFLLILILVLLPYLPTRFLHLSPSELCVFLPYCWFCFLFGSDPLVLACFITTFIAPFILLLLDRKNFWKIAI